MGYTDALLKMQYLCLGHRPLTLSVDGVVVSKDFAKASSGGFTESRHLKWTPAQRLSGLNSEFVVRLETRGSFPNLACLKFELFNSEEKVEELVNEVQAKLSDGGFGAEQALACAGALVQYNKYLDNVPEDRILRLLNSEGSEDTVSDSGESEECRRERRARERDAARKEARRAMRAKKAALMRAKKQQPSEDTADVAEDSAAQRNRDRVAARMAARREMRAKKTAIQRAQKEEAVSQDAEVAKRAELEKAAAQRALKEKKAELMRAKRQEALALRQKKLAERKAQQQEAARARMAEREAAMRKAAEDFEKEVDLDICAAVDWATSMGERKVRNFVDKHNHTSDNMTESDVVVVMHTLICMYLRRVKKLKALPHLNVTKSYTSTMLSLVDEYSTTGVFNALMQIEEEEDSEVESESGGAETESDSALTNVLSEQATKEAKLMVKHAQCVKEQEA